MKKIFLASLLLFCICKTKIAKAQFDFRIEMDTLNLSVPPAVHSGAMAQWNNMWLFIGGRKNGLHGFLPPFAFPTYDANTDIWVVDPLNNQTWTSSVDSLPIDIAEPLESSNMEYYQLDSMLYVIGGYGWKSSLNAFHTFNTLTAISIPSLINAVINNNTIAPYFRQTSDSVLQVCGGELEKIDSVYYLVFGHDFEGTYNISDTLGFFVQKYSRSIRKFQIADDGTNLSVYNFSSIYDSINFRRRDFNLIPQIFPNGEFGLTAFTGVFQQGINLPYLNTIDIKTSGFNIAPVFEQNLSQYHCATLPMYSDSGNSMYSVFFGGMSMYRLDTSNNSLIIDSLVPFTKTISMVKRDGSGTMTEYKLPIEWNTYLGTNAYFVLNPALQLYQNKIVNLDSIHVKTLAGYIVGGIESPDSNISQSGAAVSHANSVIYKVYINRGEDGIEIPPVTEPFSLISYPNPFKGKINFELNSVKNIEVKISILNQEGNEIETLTQKNISPGKILFQWNARHLTSGIYYCRVMTNNMMKVYKIVLADD